MYDIAAQVAWAHLVADYSNDPCTPQKTGPMQNYIINPDLQMMTIQRLTTSIFFHSSCPALLGPISLIDKWPSTDGINGARCDIKYLGTCSRDR